MLPPKTPRVFVVLLSSLLAAAIAASAALVTPTPPAAADTPKADANAQVKTLYAEKCSACHNLPSPAEKGYSRAEWQRTVNTMLTKYHASDEITPPEAAQIVDYLATFAPKTNAENGRRSRDPWATDALDVWTTAPASSRVFNFEAGSLAGLAPVGSGTPGPAPLCAVRPDTPGADGRVARVSGPNFRPDRFAVLLDRADRGRNVDVRVRFRIDSGKVSPAVGIVFGYSAPNQYTVLRCNQALGDLALIQIAGPAHTTLQQTPITLPAAPAAPAMPAATLAPVPLAPGWHTLRLLVHDGQARGWIDMQKRISVALPGDTGGSVGLWTQGNTSASFDDWTVDCYDPAPRQPRAAELEPPFLLHKASCVVPNARHPD